MSGGVSVNEIGVCEALPDLPDLTDMFWEGEESVEDRGSSCPALLGDGGIKDRRFPRRPPCLPSHESSHRHHRDRHEKPNPVPPYSQVERREATRGRPTLRQPRRPRQAEDGTNAMAPVSADPASECAVAKRGEVRERFMITGEARPAQGQHHCRRRWVCPERSIFPSA